jgi:tRNA modification GTPase
MDTIFALASARGKAGVAVVRLSGPMAFSAAKSLMVGLPAPRVAGLRRLSWRGLELDQALVIRFLAGASFTGEDSVELHLHGSQAVISAVLRALSQTAGLRLAEPGEFTRRALENGCLDLAQVEGLADLIDAETEAQRVQALKVLSGAIGEKVDLWREDMIWAAAMIEATIDFADEDVPIDVVPEVRPVLEQLIAALKAEIAGGLVAERIRDGFEVAIVGAPNVGKSTLLNALAGREAAITSEIAGTTRDVIEVKMDLGGLAVTFLDTAGIRETEDTIESLGVGLAVRRAMAADLRIFLIGSEADVPGLSPQGSDIVVIGKADTNPGEGMRISGKTGEGVRELVERISEILLQKSASAGILTRERHRVALQDAIEALEVSLNGLETALVMPELVAEHLRRAARSLEVLVGRIDVEALLGKIFSSFCIGK